MKRLLEEPATVIELGDSLAGSYCGRLLLQLGATVVKVEPPEGSPLRATAPFLDSPSGRLSATFAALNAGKQIVSLGLDTPEGRAGVETLLRERGDVVVMSGTIADWTARELPVGRVRELAPRAVLGRVTTFGDDGPYADIVGGELQAQALGGLMNLVGEPPREPLRMGGYQAQYSTGLALFTGFSLGLFHRAQTGEGSSFSTSVLETVSHIEWKSGLSYQVDGSIVTRGSDGAPAILRAKDGMFAFFYRPDDWPKVLAILDDPRLNVEEFATQKGRDLNRRALLELLNECTSKFSKHELYHKTQAGRMTTGYMATMGDLLDSEQYRARDFFEEIDLGDVGVGVLPGAPWRLAGGAT
jgi:crotonobetainyl-CoA:carnitine CoA-transferase CaiB-like acyl-CoA transferase